MQRLPLILLNLLILIAPLSAQNTTTEALEKRVRDLEARVDALAQVSEAATLDEIRRQIDILAREIESLKIDQAAPEAVASESLYGLGVAASKVYRGTEGVSIGGYGEMLYEGFDSTNDAGTASGTTDQLDFLRAIIYTGYKFNDRVVFNSEIEVEHATTGDGTGEVSLEFGYLDFLIKPEVNVRAGMILLPVGLVNELHEPTAYLGARRPQVEQRIIPSTWRENGFGLFGDLGHFSYRTYIVNGFRADEFSSSGIRSGRQKGAKAKAEDFAFVGRLDWHPTEGTMIGGSIYTGDTSQGMTTPSGAGFDGTLTMLELHTDVHYRGTSFRALWVESEIDDVAAINELNGLAGSSSVGEKQSGWYAELGYDLTALHPIRDWALIPYLRYESYNTQESVPNGFSLNLARDVDITTVGIAIKPIPQTVFKIDYQNVNNGAGTGVDQFNAALGYIF